MRGTVSREHYRPEVIVSRPTAEVGSRLGKQIAKLATSLALVNGHSKVTEHEYAMCRKCILDTIPQRLEDIVRQLIVNCPNINKGMTTREISQSTRYPQATVSRLLADMNILGVIDRKGKANQYVWTLSKYIRDAIEVAGLYIAEDDINRESVEVIKVKKKKKGVKK